MNFNFPYYVSSDCLATENFRLRWKIHSMAKAKPSYKCYSWRDFQSSTNFVKIAVSRFLLTVTLPENQARINKNLLSQHATLKSEGWDRRVELNRCSQKLFTFTAVVVLVHFPHYDNQYIFWHSCSEMNVINLDCHLRMPPKNEAAS